MWKTTKFNFVQRLEHIKTKIVTKLWTEKKKNHLAVDVVGSVREYVYMVCKLWIYTFLGR